MGRGVVPPGSPGLLGYPVTGLKSRVVEGGGGKEQQRQYKPQLPKGEPQAQAPGTRQAPTRPRRRRGRALSDGAALHTLQRGVKRTVKYLNNASDRPSAGNW